MMLVLLQSTVRRESLLPVLLVTFVQLALVGLLFVLKDLIVWLPHLFLQLVLLEDMHQQLGPTVLQDVCPVVSDTIPLPLDHLPVLLARSTPTLLLPMLTWPLSVSVILATT